MVTTPNGRRWHVVVVSGDAFNVRPGAFPYVVPILRRPSGGVLPPYVTELADADPVGGVAIVAEMAQVSRDLGAEIVGMLTGASMARISAALRDLFELY